LRAKTGSLTAINALAGVVTDRGGRVLTFALISNDAGPTGRTAIDAVASTLWSCGCVT
jgi:D-alanyl-D-alanine carboxypeptidase/D-alanyl-D-alanine-endopeptidase (penicillin-binding protein 4)